MIKKRVLNNNVYVNAYYSKNLKGHEFAQCGIRENKNYIELISYITPVIYVDKNTNKLTCSGTYSATTRKHISWFLKEYYPEVSYYDVKKIAGKKGEFIQL